MKIIPHSRPAVGRAEVQAASAVITSRRLAAGQMCNRLEKLLAERSGKKHGVAVSSGTAAIFCGLRARGIGSGDEVVIPSYVCTALLNAVVFSGATPVLADVDSTTGMLTADLVRRVLTRKTAAVIVPHLFGMPAPIDEIEGLGVPVIEDCAQCVGATVNRKPVGSFGEVAIFSFYATKLICGGEGGLVAFNSKKAAEAVRSFIHYDKQETWRPGFNLKLSDLHAAIAVGSVEKLDENIKIRRAIAAEYSHAFAGFAPAVVAPFSTETSNTVWFRYVLKLRNRKSLETYLLKQGIECGSPVYKPLHRYLGRSGFPGTEAMHTQALSIPIYPGLFPADRRRIIGAVGKWTELNG